MSLNASKRLRWLGLGAIMLAGFGLGIGAVDDIPVKQLIQRYSYPDSRFVTIEGLSVHYRESNPQGAETVLLLHGAGASLHTWAVWQRELAKHYRVIALDLPAFGLTGPFPDNDYGHERMMAFLDAFHDRLGLKQTHLVGNSLGGLYAWQYARHAPERVAKLVLLSPGGLDYDVPEAKAFDLGLKLAKWPISSVFSWYITPKSLVEQSLEHVYAQPAKLTQANKDRYYDLMLREGNRRAFTTIMKTYDEVIPQAAASLQRIQQPTLLMWGDQDTHRNLAVAQAFSALMPNDELRVYAPAGHVIMEEIPEQTVADALAFLARRQAL
jgi:pimeloyl-ACP methyl ester carboxylesterase